MRNSRKNHQNHRFVACLGACLGVVKRRRVAEGEARARVAFTLVELLVVIAIIALLMSILMPALARVRKQAKGVLCQANLKQLGNCFMIYVNDHQGYFMPGWVSNFDWPRLYEFYWMEALRTCYGPSGSGSSGVANLATGARGAGGEVRCCPLANIPGTEQPSGGYGEYGGHGVFKAWGVFSGGWNYTVKGDYGSFGMNGWCGNPPPGVNPMLDEEHPVAWNWRQASIKGAGTVPLMSDHQWLDGWPRHEDAPPEYDGQRWGDFGFENMGRLCINRHDGTINMLFVDFTVRRVGLKQLWKLKWSRMFDTTEGPTGDEWPEWMRGFKEYK